MTHAHLFRFLTDWYANQRVGLSPSEMEPMRQAQREYERTSVVDPVRYLFYEDSNLVNGQIRPEEIYHSPTEDRVQNRIFQYRPGTATYNKPTFDLV